MCRWDKRAQAVISERQSRLGAIVVDARPITPERVLIDAALLEGVRIMGLASLDWSKKTRQLQPRAIRARQSGSDLPDLTEAGLLDTLEDWLLPYLGGATNKAQLQQIDLYTALKTHIGWDGMTHLDAVAPVTFKAPTGTGVAIDYAGEIPKISIRLQEMMGVKVHPTVGQDRIPLLIELLSPAGRPLQTTSDLPGFWATSYLDVRKDMRGRYPKHHWPEDPAEATPTRRVKHPKR